MMMKRMKMMRMKINDEDELIFAEKIFRQKKSYTTPYGF
jgi:hypothetical protein